MGATQVGHSQVFLGGVAQGCCTALHVALTYPHNLGGIVACQGHLLSCTQMPPRWPLDKTLIYVYHGLSNEMFPWDAWVSSTYTKLEDAGANIHISTLEGVQHGDYEEEGSWV